MEHVQRGGGDSSDDRGASAAAAAARQPLQPQPPPPRTLHRALPSDPDLAARVQSVPDSAAEQFRQILLGMKGGEIASGEDDGDEDETRALVAEFLRSPNADATINRFLRAVGGKDARSAVTRLIATLRWRKETNPGEKSCEECKKVRRKRKFFFFEVGFFFFEAQLTSFSHLFEFKKKQDPRSHYMHV